MNLLSREAKNIQALFGHLCRHLRKISPFTWPAPKILGRGPGIRGIISDTEKLVCSVNHSTDP